MCARAGFVHPPPAVLDPMEQRRVSKWAEQASPRPAEVVDLVHTSIVPGDERRDETRSEGEDLEDESEMELMYPDIPSASVSKTEQSKPVEDDNNKLELIYPEVASARGEHVPNLIPFGTPQKQACVAAQKTNQSPPTAYNAARTLSRWFTDHPRVAKSHLSRGERSTAGLARRRDAMRCCPPRVVLQRCVKCSTAEWKRRRLASIDPEPPRRHKEDNAVPPPSSSPGKDIIPGWDSDLTELSSSEASDSDTECTSDSTPDPDPMPAQSRIVPTGFKIRIPLLVTRLPPGSSLQKCVNKRCHIALPKEHRWKTCDPCRNAQRMYQRLRLENKRRSLLGEETLDYSELSWRRCRSPSSDFEMEMLEMEMSLTPETSRACAMKNCLNRIPLPEVYHWKTCLRCRANARHGGRRKRDALLQTSDASCDEVVPRFPAYQNWSQLVSSFESQLKGFVEGQILYYRAKIREGPCTLEMSPMMFIFEGEYSVVTGRRGDGDDAERERRPEGPDPAEDVDEDVEAMRQEASRVVLELGCVLRATFRPGEAFAIEKGGIIMRFTCSLELIAQLRPLGSGNANATGAFGAEPSSAPVPDSGASPSKDDERDKGEDKDAPDIRPSSPLIPLMKTLTGELEAVVLPDESHRLFHGRRTVIRYRMVG
ncbi:hypothetical protein JVU11DRAFT_7117 [Chiua virens]|nr:hypothetical protein JVU11DRAFT_7117 [Chiua virens]